LSGTELPFICELARNHTDLIQHILKTPGLLDEIDFKDVERMCINHLESLESVSPQHTLVRNCNALIKLSRVLYQEVQKEAEENKKKSWMLN